MFAFRPLPSKTVMQFTKRTIDVRRSSILCSSAASKPLQSFGTNKSDVVLTYVLLRKSLLSSCDMSRNDTFAKFSSHFTSRDFYLFIADLANGCQT